MNFIDKIFVKIFYTKVGSDAYGNTYYHHENDFSKRVVIYGYNATQSSIPPLWHAWLHSLLDNIPKTNDMDVKVPINTNCHSSKGRSPLKKHAIISKRYESWDPASRI